MMKRDSMAPLMGAICCGLAMLGCSTVTYADDTSPLQVRISLENESCSAGQPIIVKYRIANAADTPLILSNKVITPDRPFILMDDAIDNGRFITFELLDQDGKPARPLPGERARPPVTMSFGTQRVSRDTPLEGRVAASAAVTPPRAGRYTLVAHVRLWYRPDATRTPNDLSYLPYSSDVKLPFQASRTDRKYLRDRAQELAEQLVQEPPGISETLIALFSIPSSFARPVWDSLLKDPRLSRGLESDIINQLARLDSLTAIGLLSDVWAGARWPYHTDLARSRLIEMHRYGSRWLRPTIEKVFVRREGIFPFSAEPKVKGYHID